MKTFKGTNVVRDMNRWLAENIAAGTVEDPMARYDISAYIC